MSNIWSNVFDGQFENVTLNILSISSDVGNIRSNFFAGHCISDVSKWSA